MIMRALLRIAGFITLLFSAMLLMAAPAMAQSEGPAFQDRALENLASPQLQTFSGENEFQRYLRNVRQIYRKRNPRSYRRYSENEQGIPQIVVAQADIGDVECVEGEDCEEYQSIVVTGSRISTPTITNVQVAGVDEGDIVKQIGDYLLILQDGRIFTVHYPSMRLTSRTDVYRKDEDGDPIGADWYDEMLVQGDQIIITAYSYREDASEVSIFKLDHASGNLSRQGVFLISSEDYYDVSNYATRIIGENLIIHTSYEADEISEREDRPVVRRWVPGEDWDDATENGKSLFDVRDIYRPVFGVEDPYVHTISICPLSNAASKGLNCRSTGFVGTERAEMFVSNDNIYLWLSSLGWDEWEDYDCEPVEGRVKANQMAPSAVMRLPVSRGDPDVMGVRGDPFNQFSMDEHDGRFRALIGWQRDYCDNVRQYNEDRPPQELALIDVSRSAFGPVYRKGRESRFEPLPAINAGRVENRFAGDWLVYGGRDSWSGRPYRYEEGAQIPFSPSFAVPIDHPENAVQIDQPHNVIRLERVGDDMIINGYRDMSGLNLTYLKLGDESAAIASTNLLKNRFETEGRSHAFNATVNEDGGGIIGVPTSLRDEDGGRYSWWSAVSDLSYLTFDSQGQLADAGALPGESEDDAQVASSYDCDVSCIDWYGNTRPFFLGGKVFGLLATDLVEAELVDGKVRELRRVDITEAVSAR